jgi:hypothetical protein
MKVYVSVQTHSWTTEPGDPDDSWDRDNTAMAVDEVTVYKYYDEHQTKRYWYPELEVDAQPGDTVFVVILRYSTGDTFGNDDGQYDVADVFKTEIEAMELQNAFNQYKPDYTNWGSNKSTPFTIEFNGKEYRIPWAGYFEQYESVDIYPCMIREDPF